MQEGKYDQRGKAGGSAENGDYRGKGLATQCLNRAREIARESHCYKMMLLTGSREEKTLDFYRRAGYNSADKTAFIQWLKQ